MVQLQISMSQGYPSCLRLRSTFPRWCNAEKPQNSPNLHERHTESCVFKSKFELSYFIILINESQCRNVINCYHIFSMKVNICQFSMLIFQCKNTWPLWTGWTVIWLSTGSSSDKRLLRSGRGDKPNQLTCNLSLCFNCISFHFIHTSYIKLIQTYFLFSSSLFSKCSIPFSASAHHLSHLFAAQRGRLCAHALKTEAPPSSGNW